MTDEIVPTAARFLGRVADYGRYRPSYPSAAIDAVLGGLGDPTALTVVDVGAGSGIASLLLLERGARVVAIEPNPEMREAAIASGVDARDGTADRTGLPDAAADVVCVFQAFHWFATTDSLAEFARILRPGGRLAIVWNLRDDGDPFSAEYGLIADAVRRGSRGARPHGDTGVESLLRAEGYASVRVHEFPSRQRLDCDGLLGRARSTSYVPRDGPEYDEVAERLRALHARFADADGTCALVYRTRVFLAERPS